MKRPSRLGKYLLLEQIHLGGIAELFIARPDGITGAEPLVALKQLLPQVAMDEEFLSLFVDEAKIAAQLSHGNIVHLLEVGKHEDTYFMAMEYVSGQSLQALLTHPLRTERPLPFAQAAFLVSELCKGLDFAHRKRDMTGRELGIVHRGVSPGNVLLGYDGGVKLIDFGLAKAASSSHLTRAGSLKGKIGYMSPEQITGLPLDRRSDIFSLGVMLFEMLTGTRPFSGGTDMEAMRAVAEAQFPDPQTLNPDLPVELEAVLLKALQRDPNDRFQWATELQQALMPFTIGPDGAYSSQHLSDELHVLFAKENEAETFRLRELAAYKEPEGKPSRGASGQRSATSAEKGSAAARAVTPLDVPVTVSRPLSSPPVPFDLEPDEDGRTQLVNLSTMAAPVGESETTLSGVGKPVEENETTVPGVAKPLAASEPMPTETVVTEKPQPRKTRSNLPAQRGSGQRPALKRDSGMKAALPPAPPPEEEESTRQVLLPPPSELEASAPPAPAQGPAFAPVPESAPMPSAAVAPPPASLPAAPARSRAWIPVVALLVLLLGGGGAYFAMHSGSPALTNVTVKVVPVGKATVTIGGRLVENGKATRFPPGEYDLVATAPGFKQYLQKIAVFASEPEATFTVLLEPEAPAPAPEPVKPAPAPVATEPTPAAKTFTARFVSLDPGVEIAVEGKTIGVTPDAQVTLPAGSAYRYTARRAGYEETQGLFGSSGEPTVTVTVALKKAVAHAPSHASHARVVQAKGGATGGLLCSTQPSGASIEVDGKDTGFTTPVLPDEPLTLPVGKHKVVFVLDGKRSAAHVVNIERGEMTVLKDPDLAKAKAPAAPSGDDNLDEPPSMMQ